MKINNLIVIETNYLEEEKIKEFKYLKKVIEANGIKYNIKTNSKSKSKEIEYIGSNIKYIDELYKFMQDIAYDKYLNELFKKIKDPTLLFPCNGFYPRKYDENMKYHIVNWYGCKNEIKNRMIESVKDQLIKKIQEGCNPEELEYSDMRMIAFKSDHKGLYFENNGEIMIIKQSNFLNKILEDQHKEKIINFYNNKSDDNNINHNKKRNSTKTKSIVIEKLNEYPEFMIDDLMNYLRKSNFKYNVKK